MALYDWNHNGEKDFGDDYLEYNLYKKSTGNNCSSGGFFGNMFIGFVVLFIVILLLGSVYEPAEPCMAIGCLEDRTENSIYCIKHRWEYK